MLFEYDDDGKPIHYSPYDSQGRTFPGPLTSDAGFWDVYRTLYPLLNVVSVERSNLQMDGWWSAYKEGGNIPSWASPGNRGSMTGNMQDATFADAIVKGIGTFDAKEAFKVIFQDATDPENLHGRKGLSDYLKLGFIRTGHGVNDEVSAALNYVLADYSIAQAAKKLGDDESANLLLAQSERGWRQIFDHQSGGYFRARNDSGAFVSPFDKYAWGGPYTEASAAQYRFYVPSNPTGLKEEYDKISNGEMCKQLEKMMTSHGTAHKSVWGLHHEQSELFDNCFGLYEHNNQPVWHIMWMFSPAGCRSEGQKWLRKATEQFYTPSAYTGDEDNGSMASWYLLSAIGLYQLAPGNSTYSIGSPLFEHVEITLDNGKTLKIDAPNNSGTSVYACNVTWNNELKPDFTIDYFELRQGGVLKFNMSSTRVKNFLYILSLNI